jgi:hypothetical protein
MPHAARANLLEVDVLAKRYGWSMLAFHIKTYTLNLERDGVKMNVYLTTFTIQTALEHPKLGKTQLNRKLLTKREREQVFFNPRQHTQKGYYKR